jgi:hypothetical protein
MRRLAMLVVMAAVMTPAMASAQQSVNFTIGGFVPRGVDSRDSNDVLVKNLDFLAFNIRTSTASRLAVSGSRASATCSKRALASATISAPRRRCI